MRVLIVDDDADMAGLLSSVCDGDGHEVTACGSSDDAIQHLSDHPVDLLITDIAMAPPDGLELVRRARSIQPELMALAITGYWGRYTLSEVLATGALDLMFKPFRTEELRARLAMAAERRRMVVEEKSRAERIATAAETVRVLLVDESPQDARDLRAALADREAGFFEVTHVPTVEAALPHLGREGIDIVLLALDHAREEGVEAVSRLHSASPDVAIVVLASEAVSRSDSNRLLQAGAQDCLVKGRLNLHPLQRALFHAMERQRFLADSETARSQQQVLREELVQHELQVKDDFISHVSHELRSPLTAIHQFSTILMDGLAGPLQGEQTEAMRVILRNIQQLESMIDDLLEITRMQTGKLSVELQSVLPAEVIADAIDTLRGAGQAKGVSLISQVPADLPTAYADPVRTRQILINLIGNAVKFTPEGGSVTARVDLDASRMFLRFEVEDTGCGLPAESLERVFERLYQVRDGKAGRRGLGLGLFICKQLVTQQGGEIGVTSELGRGSTFFFTLPLFGRDTPLATREFRVTRDIITRITGSDGATTTVTLGGRHG